MSGMFADLLMLTPTERPDGADAAYRATIDPVFTIGPKVHGGSLQAVVVRAAVTAFAEAAGEAAAGIAPVAIASDFLAAPDPAAIEVTVRIRKRGRTVSVLEVEVSQHGRLMVVSSVTMARPDQGQAQHSAPGVIADMSVEPPADGLNIDTLPGMAEVMHLGPALDLVLDADSFAVARGEQGPPQIRGWVRPKVGEIGLEFTTLACDISPPVVMNLGLFGWAPTVQLTTYLRRTPAPGWLRYVASSSEVGVGMFEEDHVILDSAGVVVAQSRQLALIPQSS